MKKVISVILFVLLIAGSPGFSLASALEYRTIDGSQNNLANTSWGKADEPLLRKTIQSYDDGQSSPRGGNPSLLSSPRSISNAVASQTINIPEPLGSSDMLWLWGQFIDHDIDLTGGANPAEPFYIPVPQGDPSFDPTNTGTQVIPFSRSTFQNIGGIREQLNQITSYIDASNVYGSDQLRSNALRTMDGTGKLKVSAGDLLPFNTLGLDNAGGTGSNLFLAGDVRANEQVSLTAMHTLFVREHNRLAEQIKAQLDNNDAQLLQALTDSGLTLENFIFESARAVVGAEIQQITYNEFLPRLLGQNALLPYGAYDSSANPQIDNEFSTAAYRVGHTMLSSAIQRINEDGTVSNPLPLQNAFFNPTILQTEGIDNIMRGMAAGHAQRIDTLVVDDVRNFLFGPPGAGGFDLVSLNIQRGRDHGLPSYNDARISMGLSAKTSFSDVTGNNIDVANALGSVYSDVNEIDLWVGGLAEPPVNGGLVGETFSKIILEQFERLRDGDRFFYLEPSMQMNLAVFDPSFQNRRLSDIILLNTDIQSIQQNVFFAVDRLPTDLDNDGIPDATDTDDDGDGIPDTLDTLPTVFSNSFSDGATTFGNIESRGDQTVTISDVPDPAGVQILAVGGGAPALVSSCGFEGTVSFDAGDMAVLTCGSVTIEVLSGSVDISYTMGGSTMTAQMITGTIMINPDPGFVSITNLSASTIMVMINGTPTPIGPNETFEFPVQPDNSQVVGGEILPINSVVLLLAGAQSSALWILPIVLAGIGLTVFILRRS